jgi:cysteine synthase
VIFLKFDRPALAMMEDAEKKNLITPGKVSSIEF